MKASRAAVLRLAAASFAAPCLAAAFGALATAPAVAGTLASAPAPATSVHRVFDIMREGSKIGTNTFDITRKGDVTNVKIVTRVLVKVMFVNAYRYDHDETAAFKANQLVSFTSSTDDNGTSHTITATQSGPKIALTVDGIETDAPRAIVPASLWGADVSNRSQLFDPGNGKRLSTTAADLGAETIAVHGAPQELRHIKLTGQFDRDLWFDKDGLVKMTMLGSDKSVITSEMRLSTAAR